MKSAAAPVKTGHAGSAVASYNPEARRAGRSVLARGGNAFDAFVAATLVEYVVAPGVTSLAGPLVALTFERRAGEALCLDAELNHVRDPEGMWAEGAAAGKGVMVPGALHGLEAIHRRYGRQPWSQLVAPALALAADGFEIDAAYSATIAHRAGILRASAHGANTFFRNGRPLAAGDRLRQPALARFLARVADDGAQAMYGGEWGQHCVASVRALGGRLDEADLSGYRSRWLPTRRVDYRRCEVHGAAGRSYGGAWSLLALKTLEHFPLRDGPHFSASAARLEVMVRIAEQVWGEAALFETATLDSDEASAECLSAARSRAVRARVTAERRGAAPARRGSHSYHVIVVDEDGNAITGTNTINALPWGDGVFVEGIPLTNALAHLGHATRPGERRLSPMSPHLVFAEGRLKAVSGTFNASLLEAGFQLLVNLIDFGLSATEAARLPRFGTFAFDDDTGLGCGKRWLDPAVPARVVEALGRRGLAFEQQGPFVDTGSGAIVVLHADGAVEAGLLPLAGHDAALDLP